MVYVSVNMKTTSGIYIESMEALNMGPMSTVNIRSMSTAKMGPISAVKRVLHQH